LPKGSIRPYNQGFDMCLGIPGRILATTIAPLPMGTVDFSGSQLAVCLAYVPEAVVGDYVLVHAGFALAVLDEDLAAEKLAALRQLDELARLDVPKI